MILAVTLCCKRYIIYPLAGPIMLVVRGSITSMPSAEMMPKI